MSLPYKKTEPAYSEVQSFYVHIKQVQKTYPDGWGRTARSPT